MFKVGGEVDAFCTRCELVLAHTIHALLGGRPVKVECNTCHSVHRYRGAPGAAARTASPGTARAGQATRERPAVAGFDELLAARDVAAVQPYSPLKRFALGDVMDHTVFGRGFVSALRDGGKIEVTFRSDVKVLVHARG